MKEFEHIKSYNDFQLEEVNWKNVAIGTAFAATVGSGIYYYAHNKGTAKLDKIQVINNEDFKKYNLLTAWQSFDLTIKDDVMVSSHSYTEGSDDNEHTVFITNIIIQQGVNEIYYISKFFQGTYASSKPFNGSKKVNLSDFKVYKQTPTYIVYTHKKFFNPYPFNYIIVNKGHTKGEEYKLSDSEKLGIYTCDRVNKDIYIFSTKGVGEGTFGGAGSGSEF